MKKDFIDVMKPFRENLLKELDKRIKEESGIVVTRNYSFWKHPIRWIRDRKKIKMANFFFQYEWKNGMKEEVEQCEEDLLLYGSTLMKDGKRVDIKKIIRK